MLLFTCDSIKKWVGFHHVGRGLFGCMYFPFVKTNHGLHNPPSLHNNYCGNAQTINPLFPYGQSP
jgi:hypothetical protein